MDPGPFLVQPPQQGDAVADDEIHAGDNQEGLDGITGQVGDDIARVGEFEQAGDGDQGRVLDQPDEEADAGGTMILTACGRMTYRSFRE